MVSAEFRETWYFIHTSIVSTCEKHVPFYLFFLENTLKKYF